MGNPPFGGRPQGIYSGERCGGPAVWGGAVCTPSCIRRMPSEKGATTGRAVRVIGRNAHQRRDLTPEEKVLTREGQGLNYPAPWGTSPDVFTSV